MVRSLSALPIALLMVASLPALAKDMCPKEDAVAPFDAHPLLDLQEDPQKAPEGATPLSGDRPLRHVWVIDYSGSMYADYSPRTPRGGRKYYAEVPEFHEFVARHVGTNFRDGKDSAALLLFNEFAYGWDGRTASRITPHGSTTFDALKVDRLDELKDRLSKVPPPPYSASVNNLPAPVAGAQDCSRPGAAANCSKMLEGLAGARALLDVGTGEGIIWLITDNIYEGGAAEQGLPIAETDENRKFYQALKDTPEYRVIVAYPVVHGSDGAFLGGTSLYVYGIYYDKDASRRTPIGEVRRLLGEGQEGVLASAAMTKVMAGFSSPKSPSPGRPFRLKPLDQDIVRISLSADVEQLTKHPQFGDKVKLLARIRVQNLLDHRVIDEVTFGLKNTKWVGYEPNAKMTSGKLMRAINPICPNEFLSKPVTLKNIGPGQSAEAEVELETTAVDYSMGSLSDVWAIATNEHVVMGGVLRADLTDVRSRTFISDKDIAGIYGAQSLPDVFQNPQIRQYTAQFVGKTKKIENPGTVMGILAILGLAALVVLGLLGSFMLTKTSRRLVIDGVDQGAISIPRLGSALVQRRTETLGRAKLALNGKIQFRAAPGYSVRREGDAWTLSKDIAAPVRIELRRSRRS